MNDVRALINRRRHQIMVHSIIYYEFNDNIISDYTYDDWCKELAQLQTDYPTESAEVAYAKEFSDFDGSTGYHLPRPPNLIARAESLLRQHIISKQVKGIH